jgi:hypothetical protein
MFKKDENEKKRRKIVFRFSWFFFLENVKSLYFDENAFFVIFKVIKMRKISKIE